MAVEESLRKKRLRLTLERQDEVARLLNSVARGEEHIIKIKTDTTLHGPLAIQYKLLRLLKNTEFDEKSFINMLLICGLAEVSKTLLKELLSVKGVSYDMLKQLFDEFRKKL